MTMRLTSTAFAGGAEIPSRYTCDGDNLSPPLAWFGAPPATRSFTILCRDPDAPAGVWYHWAIFDIPRTIDELAEHYPPGGAGMRQAINDFGKRGYGGPCPPRGHGRHHYHFTLYAVDVEHIVAPAGARCREIESATKVHALATAELIGLYAR